jgi:hypothetical protein
VNLPAPRSKINVMKRRRWNFSRLPLCLIPDRPVDLLIERRATRCELAQLIVFRTHEGGAVAESAADALAVQFPVFLDLFGKIWLGQRCPADTHKSNSAVAQIRCASLRQKFLQVAIAASDNRHFWK